MKNIIRSIPGKIIIYMLTCVFMLMAIASAGVAIFCYEENMYKMGLNDVKKNYVDNQTMCYVKFILTNIFETSSDFEEDIHFLSYGYHDYSEKPNNMMYSVTDVDGSTISESDGFNEKHVVYTYYLVKYEDEYDTWWDINIVLDSKDIPSPDNIMIRAYYEGNNGIPDTDECNRKFWIYDQAYAHRYDVYAYGIVFGILALIFFCMMLCVSARRPDSEDVHPGYLNVVPFDLMLFLAIIGFVIFATNALHGGTEILCFLFISLSILYTVIVFNALSVSAAARIKERTLISNTIIYKAFKWCWKFIRKYVFGLIRWILRIPVKLLNNVKEILHGLPLIWKSVVIFCAISFVDLIALCVAAERGRLGDYALFWFLMHIVLFVILCRFVLGLRGLQAGGRALAAGDLEHIIDTDKLKMDFKEHGENLNRISEGIQKAVDEKMKSERMKTELITNVSHDIKTPLTSIINYTDLIGKEQTDNEKITEYTEVLLRQSERLKRLIEDLVEASKASTGNLEVELAPCEASMFITQIAGEYEEKFNRAHLTLITKGTEQSVRIMADGRRMLRVFDNLMNNICKYALENSRVYLTLEVMNNPVNKNGAYVSEPDNKGSLLHFSKGENDIDGTDLKKTGERLAVITFKNTSRTELDMSPDELMERFVRGDQSRNTEGNGLGLSIARSLTELQGGTFDIAIDGDLFKVILTFPVK